MSVSENRNYGEDLQFLEQYVPIIELTTESGEKRVVLSAELQGRVMTSTSGGLAGRSYGWINYNHFQSGDTSEHINVYGGEERFWIGPEGGQFSVFFSEGSDFTFENWHTPKFIDIEPFILEESSPRRAIFTKSAEITNYKGFTFHLAIRRVIQILSGMDISQVLGINQLDEVQSVGYLTQNAITNTGDTGWTKDNGLLSIWLLGMFNPSPNTIVVIPYLDNQSDTIDFEVTDTYFGDVPDDRIVIEDQAIFFKGDGLHRCKIGIKPQFARDVLGAYDSEHKILTIVKYNKPKGIYSYVNSLWMMQDDPFEGDVVNSYNDGPVSADEAGLGPFYELETSSPALELEPGESGTHLQYTFHFEGSEELLDRISLEALGVGMDQILSAFNFQ